MHAEGWLGVMGVVMVASGTTLATVLLWITATNPLWLVETAGRIVALLW